MPPRPANWVTMSPLERQRWIERNGQPTDGPNIPRPPLGVVFLPDDWDRLNPGEQQRWMERNPGTEYRHRAAPIPFAPPIDDNVRDPIPVADPPMLPIVPPQDGGIGGGGIGTSPGVVIGPRVYGTGGSPEQYNRDALARLKQLFATYGLPPSLAEWAWSALQAGKSENEIVLELHDREEFKARFPAITARVQKGLAPLSPAEYIEYERRYRQLVVQAGFPPEFYDSPEDVRGFLEDDVSLAELQSRITDGYMAVKQAPKEVRDKFVEFFGGDGDAALAAYMLDRGRAIPTLQRNLATATAAGMGWRLQFNVDRPLAERLADKGLNAAGLVQGFEQIGEMRSLFDESVSETDDFTWQDQGVGTVFDRDTGARRKLENRIASRSNAQRSSSSGAASSERGVFGARTVS